MFYSLPMIIAVGYRVRSHRGTQFRRWATERLSEYVVKGITMDDERPASEVILYETDDGTTQRSACHEAERETEATCKDYLQVRPVETKQVERRSICAVRPRGYQSRIADADGSLHLQPSR